MSLAPALGWARGALVQGRKPSVVRTLLPTPTDQSITHRTKINHLWQPRIIQLPSPSTREPQSPVIILRIATTMVVLEVRNLAASPPKVKAQRITWVQIILTTPLRQLLMLMRMLVVVMPMDQEKQVCAQWRTITLWLNQLDLSRIHLKHAVNKPLSKTLRNIPISHLPQKSLQPSEYNNSNNSSNYYRHSNSKRKRMVNLRLG